MMELQGAVALVTGASSGIGAATALALAAKGAKVGLAARRTGRLQELQQKINEMGGESLIITMDIVSKDSVQKGMDHLIDAFGKIDILVNNAGIMLVSDVERLKTEEWERMIDVNIKGVLNVTASALTHLMKQQSGHIINISSIAGRKLFKGYSVYCATKHAVSAFSDILRMEIAPSHNIRVTSIQPGAVETELSQHTTDEKYKAGMQANRGHMTFLAPAEIANSIIFVLEAPNHVDVSELFILPADQAW
ncbi:MAG: SDR family oxidoreductase [Bacteroidetes bacterium]|nr:SDR family oxidoreductase [Bacteroidota bacterium]